MVGDAPEADDAHDTTASPALFSSAPPEAPSNLIELDDMGYQLPFKLTQGMKNYLVPLLRDSRILLFGMMVHRIFEGMAAEGLDVV